MHTYEDRRDTGGGVKRSVGTGVSLQQAPAGRLLGVDRASTCRALLQAAGRRENEQAFPRLQKDVYQDASGLLGQVSDSPSLG